MKASFFQRLCAYILDWIFIFLLLSVFTAFIPVSQKSKELAESQGTLIEEITSSISDRNYDSNEAIDEILKIDFDMKREAYTINAIEIIICIGYFIVFQFLNNGQTLGKRIMKIRIVGVDKTLTKKDIIIRTLIINSIFSGIITLILLAINNFELYKYTYLSVGMIESVVVWITIFMILYRKDKRGIHDLLTQTEVVKES